MTTKLLTLSGAMLLLFGCSSPTSPTPAVVTQPVAVTPPVVTPPVTPTRNPLLDDPRFSLSFYRMFAHDSFDSPGITRPLIRQAQAPRIYLRTIHANGSAMDPATLQATAAALINTAGSLTG